MAKPPTNVAASVRARLLNLARQTNQPFNVLLTRFVLERLLYRLSLSPHADRFVLKGAMLLTTWLPETARGTRDLDLLGFGDASEQRILGIFREVLAIAGDDGVAFDLDALQVGLIREEMEYGGVRLRGAASLSSARIAVVVDIGFGDSVEPGLETIDYPALLDLPAPRLRAYAPETVIAEKFQAMVALGRANSRMKDFYIAERGWDTAITVGSGNATQPAFLSGSNVELFATLTGKRSRVGSVEEILGEKGSDASHAPSCPMSSPPSMRFGAPPKRGSTPPAASFVVAA